ncbi:MAG: DUF2281 domain-containing protein [Dehalococcoidia bacterium]|nr:DUF2281 domain-containing protein [Dehalococcoidia bacterium]
MKTVEEIRDMVNELPPGPQREVADFVEFLLRKGGRRARKKLRQDWAGALRDYRDEFTSLGLEQKALDCRGD